MIKHYLKIALRYIIKYKGHSFINILGLAVGITCCIFVMLFVKSEFSYDKFHTKSERLYRAWVREKYENQDDILDIVTPIPLAPALQAGYPEVETTCRVYNFNSLVKIADQSFNEEMRMVDSTFFRMFDFELSGGDRNNPFPAANSIILAERVAKKYFGNENAIGKNIEIQFNNEKVLFTVAGIARSAPEESSIKYNALISFSNWKYLFSRNAMTAWFSVSPETYVLLKKGVDPSLLEKKFPLMVKQNLGEDYKEAGYIVSLQPIAGIHLDTSLPAGIEPTSNPKYSYILLTIGILILLVACINFITLSVGRSTTRAMEVGVRKVLGAERKQLIMQFWGEAFLLTMISVLFGIGFSFLLIKPFDQIANRQLILHFDLTLIIYCFFLLILIALIAGIYPALVVSGFRPVEILKGKLKLGNKTGLLRKSLIAGQFIASIGMIVCTIVISRQLNFLGNKDLGYQKDQVVIIPTNKPRKDGTKLAELFRDEIMKQPQVVAATASVMSFSETPWVGMGYTDDNKVYRNFQFNAVDPYFIKTMGIKIVQGRDFSADNPADYSNSMIVNEALLKQYGWDNAIGKKLPGRMDQTIIGVAKDFNYESLHTKVQPLVMVINPDSFVRKVQDINYASPLQPRISVKLHKGNIAENIKMLKQAWASVAPGQEFEYHFLDESVAVQYKQDQRTGTIIKLASVLSVFIACMGLFGLVTLAVVKRTKEIGIRKVLGAGVGSIVFLLSKEFAALILAAMLIALPLAWWAMNTWLQDFAYRIEISWWIFILSVVIILVIAIATISFQAVKAALMNPVKSLRTE